MQNHTREEIVAIMQGLGRAYAAAEGDRTLAPSRRSAAQTAIREALTALKRAVKAYDS